MNDGGSHVAYRDSFEQCPRDRTTLVDAGAIRACEQCQGQWLQEPILAEMVLRMLPPGKSPLGVLYKAVLDRGGEQLRCPTCGDKMEVVTIHGLSLDRCPRQHGVWFDYPELAQALEAVGVHGMAGPPPPSPAATAASPTVAQGLLFEVATPGAVVHEVLTRKQIVKIGSHIKSDVRIVADPRVARMHAIIEIRPHQVMLIDLGSGEGTLVNGVAINLHELREGDQILVGSTALKLRFVG